MGSSSSSRARSRPLLHAVPPAVVDAEAAVLDDLAPGHAPAVDAVFLHGSSSSPRPRRRPRRRLVLVVVVLLLDLLLDLPRPAARPFFTGPPIAGFRRSSRRAARRPRRSRWPPPAVGRSPPGAEAPTARWPPPASSAPGGGTVRSCRLGRCAVVGGTGSDATLTAAFAASRIATAAAGDWTGSVSRAAAAARATGSFSLTRGCPAPWLCLGCRCGDLAPAPSSPAPSSPKSRNLSQSS